MKEPIAMPTKDLYRYCLSLPHGPTSARLIGRQLAVYFDVRDATYLYELHECLTEQEWADFIFEYLSHKN